MKSFWSVYFFILVVSFLTPVVVASITIRAGSSCNTGETCLFSAWNLSNSHVGACGYYTNYTVCTTDVQSVATRTNSCNAGENTLLSFYQQNDTHIGDYTQYTNKLCSTPSNYTCAFESGSCLSGQTCLGSAYDTTNAHFAQCNFYTYQICCGADTTPPVITNQTINATEVTVGKTVQFTANVTDDFYVSTVIVTVQKPDGSLTNYTMGLLSGNLYYLNYNNTADNGAYTWTTTYANDTANNWATSTPNLQFFVAGINYTISGNVYSLITNSPLASGTITGVIKESGDTGTANVNNGAFTLQIQSYINANQSSLTLGLISNGAGTNGYGQLILGSGAFASQNAACRSKTYSLQGYAIDPTTGNVLQTGSVTASLSTSTTTSTNTTSFSNSQWSVSVTACTIPGGQYSLNLNLNAGGKSVQYQLNVIAS